MTAVLIVRSSRLYHTSLACASVAGRDGVLVTTALRALLAHNRRPCQKKPCQAEQSYDYRKWGAS